VTEAAVLLDTSAAVALVVTGHAHHQTTLDALDGRELGLSGHAWFETFAVLTGLPAPARRRPADVLAIMRHNFPLTRFLSADATAALVERVHTLGLSGGAVYDALVGAAALEHDLHLVSRDHRAATLYDRLGVALELLP
jgi:predicted nucleic acid-binding protein